MKILLVLVLFFSYLTVSAEKLVTKSYEIVIVACPEGHVSCKGTQFAIKNLSTGKKTTIVGKTMHSLCKDGTTPCRFQGYQFSDAKEHFTLTTDGKLTIKKAAKPSIVEQGKWELSL